MVSEEEEKDKVQGRRPAPKRFQFKTCQAGCVCEGSRSGEVIKDEYGEWVRKEELEAEEEEEGKVQDKVRPCLNALPWALHVLSQLFTLVIVLTGVKWLVSAAHALQQSAIGGVYAFSTWVSKASSETTCHNREVGPTVERKSGREHRKTCLRRISYRASRFRDGLSSWIVTILIVIVCMVFGASADHVSRHAFEGATTQDMWTH